MKFKYKGSYSSWKEELMCRSPENNRQSSAMDRRDFCKLSGSLTLGMAAFGGSTAMGCMRDAADSASLADSKETEMDIAAEGRVTAIEVKVISQKGTCGFGHKVGDTAKITEAGVEGRICIHALYSMFPAAFAMLYDVKFPWLTDSDRKTHPCTDAQNPVVFELAKSRT